MCRQRFISLLALTLVSFAVPARLSHAQWQVDGALVCGANSSQGTSTVVSDGAAGAIVVWADNRNGNHDIYARRISAAGVTQWTSDVPLCTTTGDQDYPTIASDGAHGAIVAWKDSPSQQIYAQRVTAAGAIAANWPTNGLALCNFAENHIEFPPAIVSDGVGGAIVTWNDAPNGCQGDQVAPCSGYDIYAQRVDSSGGRPWGTDAVPVCTAAGNQDFPKIASDGAGGAIITWYRTGYPQEPIHAQRITASGTVAAGWPTPDGVVLSAEGTNPGIVSDDSGGAIVAWEKGSGIYAQRVNSAGTKQWTDDTNGVALCTVGGGHAAIVSDGAHGAIVTWEDGRDYANTRYDIYARRVAANGTPQWSTNGVALCVVQGDQRYPTIVEDGAGGAIVTWEDSRNTTVSGVDIYAQRANADGTTQWTTHGVGLCAHAGNQLSAASSLLYPTIISDAAGGATVAWQDDRGATSDIYAQRAYVLPPTIDVFWGDTFIQVVWTRDDVVDLGPKWVLYVDGDAVAEGTAQPPGIQQVVEKDAFTPCTYHEVYVKIMTPDGLQHGESNTVSGLMCCNTSCDQMGPHEGGGGARAQRVAQNYPLALAPPRPNPARGPTEIRWSIPPERAGERFQVAVFDVGGRKVATVAEGKAEAGSFSGTLRPQGAASLTNGVYFFRLQIGNSRLTRSLILQR